MNNGKNLKKKSLALKLWLYFGLFIIVFSAVFLIPPIYIALVDSSSVGSYVSAYFIPFLLSILLIFIILVVIYIYWHMANQTTLTEKLDSLGRKLDSFDRTNQTRPNQSTGTAHSEPVHPVYTQLDSDYPHASTVEIHKQESDEIGAKNEFEESTDEQPHQKRITRSTLNYIINMGMLIAFGAVFITGFIKFLGLFTVFRQGQQSLPNYELSLIHDYGGFFLGILILAHLVLHAKWIFSMTKKKLGLLNKKKLFKQGVAASIVLLLLFITIRDPAVQRFLFGAENSIKIEGIGTFDYEPDKIETIRPDIFNPGYFSIFDILVYLDQKNQIDLNYHFNETMNTHIIDDINGIRNWWYEAFYDGGWSEDNVYRMDHYPYKEKMSIRLMQERSSRIQQIENTFLEEGRRLKENDGKVIIPSVIIRGTGTSYTFKNVEVRPHDLRDDMFGKGTITAIDVIMTLGDEGKLSYKLNWYDSIGTAEVRNYFVDGINSDQSRGRCGFVYEEGSNSFKGSKGNHIHIPSDIRVINSPDYEEWFWICI